MGVIGSSVRSVDRSHPRRVLVVGGGLAGLSAAEALINCFGSKVEVTVLESRKTVGGRAGSFQDPKTGVTVDYCQHVAMGCCVNFLSFLKRCGLIEDWQCTDALYFSHPTRDVQRYRPWRWMPAPLHQLPLLSTLKFLNSEQRVEIRKAMFRLFCRERPSQLKGKTAEHWLRQNGQSVDTIANFWQVFGCSALGDEVENVSITALRQVFQQGFAANRDASNLWIPSRPLSELFGCKLVRYLTDQGVTIHHGAQVKRIVVKDSVTCAVTSDGQQWQADHLIAAVPWHQIEKLTDGIPALNYLNRLRKIQPSSITGVHLWFDRPLSQLPHLVMVGSVSQWMFKPPSDLATGENGEGSFGNGKHYYQVVISGSQKWNHLGQRSLVQVVVNELKRISGASQDAALVHHRVVTDPRAVFSCDPEIESLRPIATTPLAELHLAGDWTQTGWPSTMEGAVISGRNAVASLATKEGWVPPSIDNGLLPSRLSRLLIRN